VDAFLKTFSIFFHNFLENLSKSSNASDKWITIVEKQSVPSAAQTTSVNWRNFFVRLKIFHFIVLVFDVTIGSCYLKFWYLLITHFLLQVCNEPGLKQNGSGFIEKLRGSVLFDKGRPVSMWLTMTIWARKLLKSICIVVYACT
jgi:hypothetical protein